MPYRQYCAGCGWQIGRVGAPCLACGSTKTVHDDRTGRDLGAVIRRRRLIRRVVLIALAIAAAAAIAVIALPRLS